MTTLLLIALFAVLIFQNYRLTKRLDEIEVKFTEVQTSLLNFKDLLQSKSKSAVDKKKTIILND